MEPCSLCRFRLAESWEKKEVVDREECPRLPLEVMKKPMAAGERSMVDARTGLHLFYGAGSHGTVGLMENRTRFYLCFSDQQ
jgi:hypothetical protein